ncbi:hypothetical protein K2Y11_20325 [bacterium]|nr:hypothetical protein [bacterium]
MLTSLLMFVTMTIAFDSPAIQKQGTIECDIVESSPVVFDKRLYYFESVRPDYEHKEEGVHDSYFRFWDVEKKIPLPYFAKGYHLGSAMVVGDFMYVFGVRKWGDNRIDLFRSSDLITWSQAPILDLPGWSIFNTSACRVGPKFVIAIEIDKPSEEAGVPFTIRFAESTDRKTWKLLPSDHVFSKDRYTACPTLKYVEGMYYMTYLEAMPGPEYETYIVRSPDLIHWESSPKNPILRHTEEDKLIANASLSSDERERITKAKNVNNSDFDFCEFEGETVILYSWGDQQGTEHLAEARFEAPLNTFLPSLFPQSQAK